MLDQRPVKALVVLEEEKVGEGGVNRVRMSPGEFDQLQPLLPTVSSPPERSGVFLWPQGASVGLH